MYTIKTKGKVHKYETLAKATAVREQIFQATGVVVGIERQRHEVVETVDGEYMVLLDGVQWGRGPRDLSGASSQTWATREEAEVAYKKGELK